MKPIHIQLRSPSFWQVVFLQSRVNGGTYRGEELPRFQWRWPQNTYLQQRLEQTLSRSKLGNSELN